MTTLFLARVLAFDFSLLLIPLITGMIGYVTNWVAIRLLFYPTDFVGIHVPGLKQLAPSLPRRIQQIPGVVEGGIGWQGIIPSRSARMGTIAAEKGISKIGTQQEFYQKFDPERIATHIVANSTDEIRDLAEEVFREEYPDIWESVPPQTREVVLARVEDRLPHIAEEVTEKIGENINEMLNINQMIADYLDEHPELINRIFLDVGDRELKFIVNSGFYIGTFLGMFSIPLFVFIDQWWVLPTFGVAVGYMTNWIALKIIFQPIQERKIGPVRLQGLFIKRQPSAAEEYAEIVAAEVVTMANIANNLMYGTQSDRTRKMVREAIRPEVDRAVGIAAPIIRMTTGVEQYERVRERFAREGIDRTMGPLQDEAFNEERSEVIQSWMAEQIKSLPPEGFVELLRPAFEEDEWMLILLGAVLGFVAGLIQLVVVTAV